MSQTSSTKASTGAQSASQHAFAGTMVGHLKRHVVQPLEARFKVQATRLGELAAQQAELRSNVLNLLGGGDNPPHGTPADTRRMRRHGEGTEPKPNQRSAKVMQLPLSDEELQDRIANQPDLPRHPNFLKSIDDPANKFWVNKILDATMKDPKD
ncbi:hypothetical protein FRC07_011326 [Ceratobasidium sp. 392]|nr:hypothetical protein FRC07_011326 [Ceratobasidium sp. 392]